MEQFLIDLVSKFPWVAVVLLVVGIFRLVFKPIMAIVESIVLYTPTPNDDVALAKFEASGFYKALLWVVNYLLSIKLPGQK